MTVRVRYAPAPTGDLHEGGAMVAVANDLLRRRFGGAFVLRVDDTDDERLAEGAVERILRDLAWLGIVVDEGPDDGPHAPYRQSQRLDLHLAVAEQLVASGMAERLPDGAIVLPGATQDVAIDDCSRGPIRIPADELDRTVLVRSDGRPTYHLATAADDHAMAITHVIRGEDHIVNSARQLLLFAAMGVEPPAYAHLPIVVGSDGAKLSGRSGALGVEVLREQSWLPAAVVDWLARSACPPITALPAAPADVLAESFDVAHLGHGTTRLDPALLATLGRDHLALLSSSERVALVSDRLAAQRYANLERVIETLEPGLGEAANVQAAADLITGITDTPTLQNVGEGERAAAAALVAMRASLPDLIDSEAAAVLLSELGVGKRSVRRVLTAADHGIPLPLVLAALTRDETLARAQAVVDLP